MNHRIRTATVAVAGLAASVAFGASASATSERANLACVTRGEFSGIDVGATRSQVERAWGVAGFASWDRSHSDPGHDSYFYRRCGKDPDDRANVVRVTYTRHARVWTSAELKAHGARVEVVTPVG